MLLELFRFDSLWFTTESYSREKALRKGRLSHSGTET